MDSVFRMLFQGGAPGLPAGDLSPSTFGQGPGAWESGPIPGSSGGSLGLEPYGGYPYSAGGDPLGVGNGGPGNWGRPIPGGSGSPTSMAMSDMARSAPSSPRALGGGPRGLNPAPWENNSVFAPEGEIAADFTVKPPIAAGSGEATALARIAPAGELAVPAEAAAGGGAAAAGFGSLLMPILAALGSAYEGAQVGSRINDKYVTPELRSLESGYGMTSDPTATGSLTQGGHVERFKHKNGDVMPRALDTNQNKASLEKLRLLGSDSTRANNRDPAVHSAIKAAFHVANTMNDGTPEGQRRYDGYVRSMTAALEQAGYDKSMIPRMYQESLGSPKDFSGSAFRFGDSAGAARDAMRNLGENMPSITSPDAPRDMSYTQFSGF